ncbi:MAG: PASTA domain-containing protein [Myxococcota bacterium]
MSESHDRGRTLYLAVFAAMLTSAATTYGLRALEGGLGQGEDVEVPSLISLEQATASELVSNRGLRLVVRAQEPSADQPAGAVAEQEPLAGSLVPADTAVTVVISSGPPQVTIPSVVGQPLDQARTQITSVGLAVGTVSETGEGPPGTVTALTPAPGSEVDLGTTVNITAVPAGIEIPDVLGTTYRRVREQLTELGLEVKIRRRYDENRPDFVVLSINPEVGQRVPPGSEVTITIND